MLPQDQISMQNCSSNEVDLDSNCWVDVIFSWQDRSTYLSINPIYLESDDKVISTHSAAAWTPHIILTAKRKPHRDNLSAVRKSEAVDVAGCSR